MWRDGEMARWQSGRIAVAVIALLLLSIMVSSCGLKRSNPLDPLGNDDVVAPDPVVGITVNTTAANQSPRVVTLRWTANSSANTSGYYVYRGLSYNSAYALVGTVQVNEFVHSSANDPSVMPGDYYYKISAFKSYPPAGNLEGRKSEPIFARLP